MGDATTASGIDRDLEMDLVARAQAGDRRASGRLVAAHRGAIFQVVHHWRASKLPQDDLEQEATIGLLEAIKRFDVTRGVRLLSYAMVRMHEVVREYVFRQKGTVSLASTRARIAYRALKKGQDVETIAASAGMATDLVASVQTVIAGHVVDADDADLRSDSFESELLDADEEDARKRALSESMTVLTEQERHVMQEVYLAGEKHSIAEVSRGMGVSRARGSQVHISAMDKLRRLVPKAMATARAAVLSVAT